MSLSANTASNDVFVRRKIVELRRAEGRWAVQIMSNQVQVITGPGGEQGPLTCSGGHGDDAIVAPRHGINVEKGRHKKFGGVK